jgi:hypothetical protein
VAGRPGYVERRSTVTVVGGGVVRQQWTLEPDALDEGMALGPTLPYGGGGAVALA